MPRRFVIAAALAPLLTVTVLTVTACGSTQPTADAGAQPMAEHSESRPSTETGDAQDGALRSGTMAAVADDGEPGLPAQSGASIDDVLRLGAVATWVDAPDVLAISLPASAECWATASEPVAVSEGALSIEFLPGKECGEPDAARTYTVEVPEGVEAGGELEVAVEGLRHQFTLTLPES
ncbi:hypothetical protein [Agrococcus baldri]|uniref:Lipoprotein n=1 Tax=Agrococcus baldri TaxID=153730 RepID=A0AA87RHJ6_9MICO|nr:hypothetical protein [Agrococcus baldri]GEK79613.1 hypothetical protein ABA31_09640 [Agrococcus baldri]